MPRLLLLRHHPLPCHRRQATVLLVCQATQHQWQARRHHRTAVHRVYRRHLGFQAVRLSSQKALRLIHSQARFSRLLQLQQLQELHQRIRSQARSRRRLRLQQLQGLLRLIRSQARFGRRLQVHQLQELHRRIRNRARFSRRPQLQQPQELHQPIRRILRQAAHQPTSQLSLSSQLALKLVPILLASVAARLET